MAGNRNLKGKGGGGWWVVGGGAGVEAVEGDGGWGGW